jgi:2-keto-4-pentenoate hydratase/2-oxohepta-3-ene-1,7-dioic acid hydratase in catechol pathway
MHADPDMHPERGRPHAKAPSFLRPGQVVDIDIEGIGTLVNTVVG